MKFKFANERLNFCLNTYAQTKWGETILHKFFSNMPPEFVQKINAKQNYSVGKTGCKYSVNFNYTGSSESVSFEVVEGKKTYIITAHYSNFDKDVLNLDETRTLIYYEEREQKGIFSPPKKTYYHYAFLDLAPNPMQLNFIESTSGKAIFTLNQSVAQELASLPPRRQHLRDY